MSANDWERLARTLRAELRHRGWTQAEFAYRAGVGTKTVNDLASGRERARIPSTTRAIEDALDWPRGTVQAVLDGEEPPKLRPALTEREQPELLFERLSHGARQERDHTVSLQEAAALIELLRRAVDRLPVNARARAILTHSADDLEWKLERAVRDDQEGSA